MGGAVTINYTIEAKPTFYNGVQFRSRLEAKWAAFFDGYGYQWTYEPIDFGGWSPDFFLKWNGHSEYIEIKPITYRDKETSDKMNRHCGSGGMILCGLTPDYCWINWRGWWDDFKFGNTDTEIWKTAGNEVQWLPS